MARRLYLSNHGCPSGAALRPSATRSCRAAPTSSPPSRPVGAARAEQLVVRHLVRADLVMQVGARAVDVQVVVAHVTAVAAGIARPRHGLGVETATARSSSAGQGFCFELPATD